MRRLAPLSVLSVVAATVALLVLSLAVFQRAATPEVHFSELARSFAARAARPGMPCPLAGAGADVQLGDISARLVLARGAEFPVLELRNDSAEPRAFGAIVLEVIGPDGARHVAPFGGPMGARFGVLVGGAIDVTLSREPGVWTSVDPPFSIEPGAALSVASFGDAGLQSQVVFDLTVGAPHAGLPDAGPTPAGVPRSPLAIETAAKAQRGLGAGCPIVAVNQAVELAPGLGLRARVERSGPDGVHYVIEERDDGPWADVRAYWRIVAADGAVASKEWLRPGAGPGTWGAVAMAEEIDRGGVVQFAREGKDGWVSVLFDLPRLAE